jgi:hypothetical protein
MPRYDECRHWACHNSYEGDKRGWVSQQLDNKVRCIEFDIWDNDYEKVGDFRLGHLRPGHAVALGTGQPGENPRTYLLSHWLKTVAAWSATNDHAVITIVLDVKSDITGNKEEGDLEDLNETLEKAFGSKLYTREEYDAAATREWPDASLLRNRIICVLSGNSNTRMSYRYCSGQRPAIAANPRGDVVIAYRSLVGDMRYWSGKARPRDERVEWRRRAAYAFNGLHTVSEPSLALTDDGFVVSVHRVGPKPNTPGPAFLECMVGELQEDGRITWGDPHSMGAGFEPSVALVSATRLQEIHRTASGKSLKRREGALEKTKLRVKWEQDSQATEGPQFPRDTVAWKGHQLRSLTNVQGVIFCAFDTVQRAVGYRQVAFVEMQKEETRADLRDPLFYGASAGEPQMIANARRSGLVARAWWFKEDHAAAPPGPPRENWAGTDFPLEDWYTRYMNDGGQAEF